MAKTLKGTPSKGEATAGFPVPFSLEDFRNDIAAVYLHQVRCIAWMTDAETAWPITKTPAPEYLGSLFYTDCTAADLGITYDRIRETNFATYMECLYNYAFFGKVDANKEAMEDESIYTWFSALICDAARGEMSMEYDLYGVFTADAASRCLLVAETANARVTLEGGEPFFSRFQRGKEGFLESELLTIRQMSLLAGMEEMSIRAAANPKRPNPLKTENTENGTRIEIGVAKEWLQHKGRYVPISRHWTAGEIDLSKRQFMDIAEFDSTLYSRFQMLKSSGIPELEEQLKQAGIQSLFSMSEPFLNHDPKDPAKVAALETIGQLLDLSPELLFLRAKEAEAKETLKSVERALRNHAQAS